ncbi:DNA-directed RNA polymerase subunit K [Desulfurococcus amylolyticus 1221n]|uniref:DNA-directed RNA polymerase subunit Rpo6 n=1 Tax=Desulfurococcus amylolyticus (strain DSM 18924 / JCM 16383 / VKM B-2413 / 1221n) TaxID=490899 RepID=B8D5H9_DESA1|nr:DNA-directed RNA polymerase subunit K [Desulfurococcus amylolyticus]ACL11360.1 DNA-directed RNA polymerase subunit K [Desulfurococcus amylolyticus 1221n]
MSSEVTRIYEEVFSKRLTRFEIARVVGARALQLSMGAPPIIDVSNLPVKDPVYIAVNELITGLLPMSIRRINNGREELVPVGKLLTPSIRRSLEMVLESWSISRRV